MRNSWRIGRIMGIDIALDPSWFIILALLIFSFGFVQFPRELHPRSVFARPDAVSITLGIAASLLLFASVLAHELSHSWMAIRRGIPVISITLFIFGGLAQIADEPDQPGSEFLIAVMGPLMSAALAMLFGAAWIWMRVADAAQLSEISLAPFIALTGLLFQANGALAVFNLAPGFPLDGGRIFRAILWRSWHDLKRATLWATRAGMIIAVLIVGIGAWFLLREGNTGGIWNILIGFFLWNAARESYRQTMLRETLRGVRVSQLMTREVATVVPDMTIAEFVEHCLLPRREQTFVVSSSAEWVGVISFENVKRISRKDWTRVVVRQAMTPRALINSLDANDSAVTALARLARSDEAELAIVQEDRIVGFVGRDQVLRFLHLKAD